MGDWKSASHNKYLLQYHLIFVCRYRKQLLINQYKYIADNVKRLSTEICNKHRVNIKYNGKSVKTLGQRSYTLYDRN